MSIGWYPVSVSTIVLIIAFQLSNELKRAHFWDKFGIIESFLLKISPYSA